MAHRIPLNQTKVFNRVLIGRLLLIDRVTHISGRRKVFDPPASIITEVDIQPDAWFLQSNVYQGVPLAILMEIALQPCGFLSAYIGTSLVIPPENNIFRNLDGWIRMGYMPALAGKTITNKADLIKTTSSSGLFIQFFKFELAVDGSTFLFGESSFGYFTQSGMENQVGLTDGGRRLEAIERHSFADEMKIIHKRSLANLPGRNDGNLLDIYDQMRVNPQGGRFGFGEIIGQKTIKGDEWFFENHFFQDPVMPGSLGIEVCMRGISAFLRNEDRDLIDKSHSIMIPDDHPLRWKYRGQVLPTNRQIYFEVQIKEKNFSENSIKVIADADFWVDDLRIYSIENLSMIVKVGTP